MQDYIKTEDMPAPMREQVARLRLGLGQGDAARTLSLTIEEIAEDLHRFPETECLPVYRTTMGSEYTAFFTDATTVEALSLLRIVNWFQPLVLDPVTGFVQLLSMGGAHDYVTRLLDEVVDIASDLLAIPCRGFRRSRWRAGDAPENTGIEADQSYYLGATAAKMVGMGWGVPDDFVDSHPLHLVAELADGPFDAQRTAIYRAQGVQEYWQVKGARNDDVFCMPDQVTLLDLQGGDGPTELPESRVLPGLTPAIIGACLVAASEAGGSDPYQAIRQVLVNHEVVPVDAKGHPGGLMSQKLMIKQVLIDHGVIPAHGNRVEPEPERITKALIQAASGGDVQALATLLKGGADANAQNRPRYCAMEGAVYHGHTECVRLLIEHGADIHRHVFGHKNTALGWAAIWGHTEIVRLLLEAGAVPGAQNSFGETPLHCAAEKGHVDIIRLLLDAGADVNAVDEQGNTPLHAAAAKGREDALRLLLDRDADINAANRSGVTALQRAARYGHYYAARLLLELGADVTALSDAGDTALHWTVRRADSAMVQLLLNDGADIHARGSGLSPLDLAAKKGEINLVRRLLPYGLAVRTGHIGGDVGCALHWAVKWGDAGMARLLLDHVGAAAVGAADRYGKTPACWARTRPDHDMDNLLMEAMETGQAGGKIISSVIHRDPGILGGQPVFIGTRLPVYVLMDHVDDGATWSLEYFLDSYPTASREQVTRFLECQGATAIRKKRDSGN